MKYLDSICNHYILIQCDLFHHYQSLDCVSHQGDLRAEETNKLLQDDLLGVALRRSSIFMSIYPLMFSDQLLR